MSATRMSFADWRDAMMVDLRERIERLAAVDVPPQSSAREYISGAREAWCRGDVVEVERLLAIWDEKVTQEREWMAEHDARWGKQP
jgi:hypothetical protein